jgi:uncharacterized membrane protein YhaH (DUF805 family)
MDALSAILVAQGNDGGGPGGAIFMVIWLAILVVIIAGMWKVYSKAGQPGWGCLIPIYNAYLLCKIAGRPGWWVLLFFIPIVGLIMSIIVIVDVAKNFGKGVGFALGLIFLGFIFFPILGFGDAQYMPVTRV